VSGKRAADAFTRLSTVLNLLQSHPQGLRVDYLASQVGVPEATLRQEMLDFYAADTMGVRPDTIVFVSEDGSEADPHSAEVLRVVNDQPGAELGVQYLSAQRWLEVYAIASRVSEMRPEDGDLAAAVGIIAERILGDFPTRPDSDIGRVLATAITHRRAVRLQYSRAWQPGVTTPTVHPLRLVETARGWELDAALPDGGLRTYIIERIRSAEPTGERFSVPDNVRSLLAEQRRPTTVGLVVPQGYQWVVDRYADSSEVVDQDEADIEVRADFLPPVAERVGLILITAPGSFVSQPQDLETAARETAGRLLQHHGL
jgi:predicted DNA-binding transcriptional regulator YafY